MLFWVLFLVFCTVGLVAYQVIPAIFTQMAIFGEKREQKFSTDMEHILSRQKAKRMGKVFVFAPISLGVFFYFFFPPGFKLLGVIIGLVGGIVLPGVYIKLMTKRMQDKFSDQLVDALMIMSSSFRGGLSLIQAMEAVVDEMPDPVNREFGVVLGENKMGVALEEALTHLYKRMPLVPLQQMNTAILLARETGGNLPIIFSRIVNNIRENKKIQQMMDTLTLQGKLQGIIMIFLPIGFGFLIYSTNRPIFEHMFKSSMGRSMLSYAVVSEIIGAYLIWKISSFKEF